MVSDLEKKLLSMIASWDSSMLHAVKNGPLSVEDKIIISAITECKADIIKVIKESKLPGKLN